MSKQKPLVVLDTNLWIGLVAERPKFEEQFKFAKLAVERVAETHDFVFTEATYQELEYMLTKSPKIVANTDPEMVQNVLSTVRELGIFFEVEQEIQGFSPDETDHRFLEAAVVSGAEILLSNNINDLGHLIEFQGVPVLTAEEFILREDQQPEFEKVRSARVQNCRSRLQEKFRQEPKLKAKMRSWQELEQDEREL